MIVEETDEDKRLITGEVIVNGQEAWEDTERERGCSISPAQLDYPVGTTIIFGKYAIFPLTLQGEDFFFLDENDVIGTCDYRE